MKRLNSVELMALMNISVSLAESTLLRCATFSAQPTLTNARQALALFKGDVYDGFELGMYSVEDLEFANKHLCILSGLYGSLKPLDLVQPYRLEMNTKLSIDGIKDISAYWSQKITQRLNQIIAKKKNRLLLNLASSEYSKVIDLNKFEGDLVNVVFKEEREGHSKVVAIYAKRARGLMANYIIKNKVTRLINVKDFAEGGYQYMKKESSENALLFIAKR